MSEGGSKNWAEGLLALFQEHVPKPLRKTITFALAILVVSFTAIKAFLGSRFAMSFSAVTSSPY